MRVLFVTGRLFAPDRIGGAEECADSLLKLLQADGHQCEAVAQIRAGAVSHVLRLARWFTGRRRLKGWPDRRNGYVTYRYLSWMFREVVADRIRAFAPDVVVTQLQRSGEAIDVARSCGVPPILTVCDAEFQLSGEQLRSSGCLVISLSQFLADWVRRHYGVDSQVVYPIVDVDRYRFSHPDPQFITLINPSPVKGLDVALDIAVRLPNRRFLFQEAWALSPAELQALKTRLALAPNVTLQRATRDMGTVYQSTVLLIVPSRWEEGFGRVIIEAQASGIPVVARAVGGIPEAVGAGGIVMPASAGAHEWAEAIDRVLSDGELYGTLSKAARANTTRPEFDPRTLARRFATIAEEYRAAFVGRAPGVPGTPSPTGLGAEP